MNKPTLCREVLPIEQLDAPDLRKCMESSLHSVYDFKCAERLDNGVETEAALIYVEKHAATYLCDNHADKYAILLALE